MSAAGSILLCSNGAYWSAIYTDASGQRRKRGLGSKRKVTRAGAMAKIARLAQDLQLEAAGGLPTLAGLLAVNQARTGVKPATRQLIERSVKLLMTWAQTHLAAGPETPIDIITKADASAFAAWLHEQGRGPSGTMNPLTRAGHLRALRTIWFVVAEPLPIPILNPWAKRRWTTPTTAHDWHEVTLETLRRLMAVTEHPGVKMQLALCRLAGLRSGEARRLRWRDVDLARGVLTVLPEIGAHGQRLEGTKQRARTVPICPELSSILSGKNRQLRKPMSVRATTLDPDAPVCPDLPTPTNVHRMLLGGKAGTRKLASGQERRYIGLFEKAGLEPWDRPFHTLRKCCGTDWGELGIPLADIAAWMGNSPAVAARLYLRTTPTTWSRITGLAPQSAPQKRVTSPAKTRNSLEKKNLRV